MQGRMENAIIRMTPPYWEEHKDEIREIIKSESEKGNYEGGGEGLFEIMDEIISRGTEHRARTNAEHRARTGVNDVYISYNPKVKRIEGVVMLGRGESLDGEPICYKHLWYSHPKIHFKDKQALVDRCVQWAREFGAEYIEFVTQRNPRAFERILSKFGYEKTPKSIWRKGINE